MFAKLAIPHLGCDLQPRSSRVCATDSASALDDAHIRHSPTLSRQRCTTFLKPGGAGKVADGFHLHCAGPAVALGLHQHDVRWPNAHDVEDAQRGCSSGTGLACCFEQGDTAVLVACALALGVHRFGCKPLSPRCSPLSNLWIWLSGHGFFCALASLFVRRLSIPSVFASVGLAFYRYRRLIRQYTPASPAATSVKVAGSGV